MSKIVKSFPYAMAQLIFYGVASKNHDIETWIGFLCQGSYFHTSGLIDFARAKL